MEQYSIVEVYQNALDEKSDVEMEHKYIKDNECKEEKQESQVRLNELTDDTKDEPWEINVHDNNENNEYVSSGDVMQSQQLKSGPSYENTSEIEIIPELNNVFGHKFVDEHHFEEFDFKQTVDFDLSYDENNTISNSFSDMDNFYCSLYSTSLSSPSNISHFSCSLETKEDVEDFETLSLVKSNLINDTLECELLQYVLENVNFEDNNGVYKNSECFVGNRIIGNPEIMYNIELRLHLRKMQLLAEQVSKTPYDLTVLNKCMELTSIPEMKKGQQMITEECGPLPEVISISSYNNQYKDRNKIKVNQVAEHSHTKFDFTSRDTLFLLRDKSIDDIKRLADMMKTNFDIQSKSSTTSTIEPIQNRLQEKGLNGDVTELIEHYETDVFSRRKRLLKDCEHFQLLINQFVKQQSTSKINSIEENLFTEEKSSTSAESEYIDTVPIKSENIKTNTADFHDRKMYFTKSSNTDVQFNDLLKCSHMISTSSNSKSNSYMSTKSFLNTDSLSNQENKKNNLLKNEKHFNLQKTNNIFDATKNIINIDKSKIQSTSTLDKTIPNCVKSIGLDQASFQKIIDEFKGNSNYESNNNPDINNAIDGENYSDNPSCKPNK